MSGHACHRRRAGPGLAAVLLAASVMGCSAYETVNEMISPPVVLNCPAHRVIADAAEYVKFRDGPGRDLTDVEVEGKIVDVRLACASHVDKKTLLGTMDVEVTVVIGADRGPADDDRRASFPYFISVVGPKREILYNESFTVGIDFPGNRRRVRFRNDPVTLEIPLTKNWSNRSYTIFTGFKLTPEELEFNRVRRRQQAR